MKQSLEALLHYLNLPSVPEWLDLVVTLSKVMLILMLAWVLFGVAKRLIRLFHVRLRAREESVDEIRRIDTLERVFVYALSVIVIVITIMRRCRNSAFRSPRCWLLRAWLASR